MKDFLIALNSPVFLCHPLDYKIRDSYSLVMWKVKCVVTQRMSLCESSSKRKERVTLKPG